MQIHNFKFEESHYIDEICSTFLKYVHPSGLKVIKINNLDPQNVACIHFQTIPENSNGCPHILEHVVLCGSKKYDVKDPFFSMLRRSIAGFANAFTGSDFTAYPFAAHVKEDFFNLFDVYLDAVFHPLIDKASFLQEGSRYTEEGYKGIVFNEMKQSNSSLHDRFHHETLSQLFPDTPYRFDSGGTPKEIVTLTHEKLVAFHKENYHPSNALIFLYGNLDIDAQLAAIEKAIKDIPVKPKPTNQRVLQPRFKQKKEHHTFYPATAEDKTKHLTIGFVLGDQKNQDHLLDALFLKGYLAGHDGSPLQRAIMGENLASSVDVLVDLEVLEPYIYFIFKDVLDPQKLIATFDKTLEQISLKGFDEGAKNASLHQLKIAFLNTAEMGYPTGLVLFFKGVLPYFNGGDPLELFCFKKRLEKLEKRVADPLYLKKAIKETFLDNPHRAEVYFTNKPHLLEEELPAPIVIDAETKKRIAEETQLIDSKQSKPQDSSCLPILQIEQLPPRPPTYSLEKKGGEIPIFVHNSWTNGLSYFHLMIDLPDLDENASHYLGLMVHFLGAIGTRKRDFHQLIEKKESFLSQFSLRIDGTQKNLVLYVEGESLSENLKEGFLLIKEILEETVFSEKERLQEIMKDLFNTLKARFTQRSYGRCILHGKSHLRTAYQAIENSKGFSFFNWLKKEMTQPIDATIKELETLYQRLLKGDGLLEMSLCTDLKEIPPFSLNAPKSEPAFINSNIETKNKPQFFGFCVPIQASENAYVFNGFRFDDVETPIARVVVQLIKHLQLHPILREKHGAYGASISMDPEQGLFAMYTTCDPNIDLTYQIFQEVFKPIIAGEFSEEDLYEAKLAALQVTEEISLLNMRAHDQYWRNRLGRTESKRLDDRNRLIKADRSAIRECTAKILGNLTGGISVTLSARKAFENLQHHPSTLVEL
jgi:Zn-dependent M16 (insulinase) family peptidase